MKSKVRELAERYYAEVLEIRRYLHKHPELSQKEYNTANFISQKLTSYGVDNSVGIGETGVVATIYGAIREGRCVALRADMDALPIWETNVLDYKSVNDGVMHACGHDFHVASLLGVAKILNEIRDSFKGCVKLIFQPSEEMYPGGARMMIDDGVLENPKPDVIIAQHVIPQLPTGSIGLVKGGCMASTDEIHLKIRGKGGHAAMPHNCIDTILIASQVVVSLQQVVSRRVDPNQSIVLTFGNFEAKGRTNIIPDFAFISGTLRAYSKDAREVALKAIVEISTGIALAMGGVCEVDIVEKYPVLVNDDNVVDVVESAAYEVLGGDKICFIDKRMTAEDFAIFAEKIPACFYRIGTGNSVIDTCNELHTPNFKVDDAALINAMVVMSYAAIKLLNN